MQKARGTWLIALVALAVALTTIGCGAKPTGREVKGVAVSGKLLQKGQVIKLKKDESILISFILQGSDPQIATHAEYNPDDGSFIVKGPSGQGIPPGKYKIGLTNDFYGGGDGTSRFGEEMDSEKTPLVADVGGEEGQFFEVDVGTKRVKKK
jgi:hypothetical protein